LLRLDTILRAQAPAHPSGPASRCHNLRRAPLVRSSQRVDIRGRAARWPHAGVEVLAELFEQPLVVAAEGDHGSRFIAQRVVPAPATSMATPETATITARPGVSLVGIVPLLLRDRGCSPGSRGTSGGRLTRWPPHADQRPQPFIGRGPKADPRTNRIVDATYVPRRQPRPRLWDLRLLRRLHHRPAAPGRRASRQQARCRHVLMSQSDPVGREGPDVAGSARRSGGTGRVPWQHQQVRELGVPRCKSCSIGAFASQTARCVVNWLRPPGPGV
jgi:hypothetical protein